MAKITIKVEEGPDHLSIEIADGVPAAEDVALRFIQYMTASNARMRQALEEVDEYLAGNRKTGMNSGSLLHLMVREALGRNV